MRLYQLDGLRALALLLVVLLHHSLLPSGWAGVDIFFVLSGFLITGILRHDVDKPAFWRTFYTKRATRILPPLVAVFLVAVLAAPVFKLGFVGYLLFAGNILPLTSLSLPMLSPVWSLAIEEHFYFLWPLAVRKCRRETLIGCSVAIIALSPLVRLLGTLALRRWAHGSMGWDNPIFLLTPFRIDGLAAGAMLSLLLEDGRRPAWLARWSGPSSAALAALFLAIEVADPSFRRTTDNLLFNSLGYSLVVSAAFFLVAHLVANPASALAKVLSSKPAVFLGSISYGFYLYEESVIFGVRYLLGFTVSLKLLFLPDVLITAAIATASLYFIEKPIMSWGRGLLVRPAEIDRFPALEPQPAIDDMPMEDIATYGSGKYSS